MSISRNGNALDSDRYFSGKAPDGTMIYIGPVTREQAEDCGFGGDSVGYYLCEFDVDDPVAGVEVLAYFPNIEAAYRFAEVIGLFQIDQPLAEFDEPLDLSGRFHLTP